MDGAARRNNVDGALSPLFSAALVADFGLFEAVERVPMVVHETAVRRAVDEGADTIQGAHSETVRRTMRQVTGAFVRPGHLIHAIRYDAEDVAFPGFRDADRRRFHSP